MPVYPGCPGKVAVKRNYSTSRPTDDHPKLLRHDFPVQSNAKSSCYFSPGSVRSIVVSMTVCLSVYLSVRLSDRSHTPYKPHIRTRPKFSARSRGYGLILLCRHCNTLCTFAFVDDVMFSYNGLCVLSPHQPRSSVVYDLPPAARYWLRRNLDEGGRKD